MIQQRKPNILRFRSCWQNTSKAFNAVIVTPLVALMRIMVSWLRSWWQNTSKKQKIVQIIVLVVVVGLIVSFIGGYFFNWTWTGFGPYTPPTSGLQRGKTLYDWLQLAIIPAAIAFGVWSLNRLQQKRDQQLADERAKVEREAAEKRADTEREIALDNQREAALKEYFDKMSELMLHENLSKSDSNTEVRKIARVLTLTVLHRLDKVRKRNVLQFLYESGLIEKGKRIVGLREADLNGAYLFYINLPRADLSEVILTEANLFRADLRGADLSKSYLHKADLHIANLSGANLRTAFLLEADLSGADLLQADLSGAFCKGADLTGAKVTTEQLDKAKSLEGAIMPDGTIHA